LVKNVKADGTASFCSCFIILLRSDTQLNQVKVARYMVCGNSCFFVSGIILQYDFEMMSGFFICRTHLHFIFLMFINNLDLVVQYHLRKSGRNVISLPDLSYGFSCVVE